MKLKACAVLLCALFACSTTSMAADWQTNYQSAMEQAKKENKTVLLDFTGSDWCGWCIKLKKEVFNTSEFKDYADKNLVLVELDFPRGKAQSAELKQQNRSLQAKYGIKGYPTIVVLNSEGAHIGTIGYRAGGPNAWLGALNQIISKK